MAADQAPLARPLPARASVPRAHADCDRLAARCDGGVTRPAVPGRPGGRRGAQRRYAPARPDRDRVRRRGRAWGALQLRPDLLHRLDRRTHAGRPAERPLPSPATAVPRLLRAKPRRRDHQPPDERRRGTRPARHRRGQLADPEHTHTGRHRGAVVLPRLAAGARDDGRDAADGRRDGVVPETFGSRVSLGPGDARPGDRDARGGHRRDASAPVVHPGGRRPAELPADRRRLPRREHAHGRPERPLLPVRRLPLDGGNRGGARLRRLACLQRRGVDRHRRRVPRLPHELLRPGPAALTALQHLPFRRRGARQDH